MPTLSFRHLLLLLSLLTTLITLMVSGTAIFFVRDKNLQQYTREQVDNTAKSLVLRTESSLGKVEQTLVTLLYAYRQFSPGEFTQLMRNAMRTQSDIRALYFLDGTGSTTAIWTSGSDDPYRSDFLGVDFSYTQLYRDLLSSSRPVWSDKFVSSVVGDISVGVGMQVGDSAAIAELDLNTLLKTVEVAAGKNSTLWVVDRLGEVLVDTNLHSSAGVYNFRQEPVFSLGLAGEPVPEVVQLQGSDFHPGAARSEKLGWLFIAGIPAGLGNPLLKNTLIDILLLSGSFLFIALLLSPFILNILVRQLSQLRTFAGLIADGRHSAEYERGLVAEFNDLTENLEEMAQRIREREESLQMLNLELEERVVERTKALEVRNQDLRESLAHNTAMQEILVETEKQAALGRLVAGVAHELNTPIGNAVMAISTLKDEKKYLADKFQSGLRKSEMDQFLEKTEQGLEIAERNVNRAADLISSFKHVATDQASSARRDFEISEMVQDVLLTLHPMLKRSPHKLVEDLEEGLKMDSYPGVIGQILTNLITNALTHAWDDGESGTIIVTVRSAGDDSLRLSVADDGRGIPESFRKRIFEPFYTTKMGRGGTGLGLNIAMNGAKAVLGGNLVCESAPQGGTVFHLDIPRVAPVIKADDRAEFNREG